MALTFEQLQEFVKKEGLHYLIDPQRPAVRMRMGGLSGPFDMAVVLQEDGKFLQLRSIALLACPATHANLPVVLRVLAEVNFQKRFVKFGWDPSDGELMAYGDAWVMDGTLTQEQFRRMMSNFVPVVDELHGRLKATIETGKDPGEAGALAILAGGPGRPDQPIPPELKELLEKLAAKAKELGVAPKSPSPAKPTAPAAPAGGGVTEI
jgi:hypothetical protein